MPKMKTFRGAKKRFSKTASGKFRRGRAYGRHLLTTKSRGRKRSLGETVTVTKGDAKRLSRMLPYI